MMTHRYRFPTYGEFKEREDLDSYRAMLEDSLKNGPDCIMSYCIFPTDGDILEKVDISMDDGTKIDSVTLRTYSKLWDGCGGDLRNCVEACLAATSQEYFGGQPYGILIEGDTEYLGQWDDDRKQTYQYSFPASGRTDGLPVFIISQLEGCLREGYDCLGAYCMFDTHSDILDHVSIRTDGNGNVTAVDLHTYTKLWDGNDSYLKDCVETNLAKVTDRVRIDGNVVHMGRKGSIPEKLYHITEKDRLGAIMEQGLQPGQGSNSYKNMEDYVYLSSEKDLAPWLCILKHLEDPAILEVDTAGLYIEQGRVFSDRGYVNGCYGEYRTKETIPPSAIITKDMKLQDMLSDTLRDRMAEQLARTDPQGPEWEKVSAGMGRLEKMGILSNEHKEEQTFIDAVNRILPANGIRHGLDG